MAALGELASKPAGARLQAAQLARALGLPPAFLSKILGKLVRYGVLRSLKGGSDRGYVLARAPRKLSVREIIEAIEGPGFFERCVFGGEGCSERRPCVLHPLWRSLRPVLQAAMTVASLAEVAREAERGPRLQARRLAPGAPRRRSAKLAEESARFDRRRRPPGAGRPR